MLYQPGQLRPPERLAAQLVQLRPAERLAAQLVQLRPAERLDAQLVQLGQTARGAETDSDIWCWTGSL